MCWVEQLSASMFTSHTHMHVQACNLLDAQYEGSRHQVFGSGEEARDWVWGGQGQVAGRGLCKDQQVGGDRDERALPTHHLPRESCGTEWGSSALASSVYPPSLLSHTSGSLFLTYTHIYTLTYILLDRKARGSSWRAMVT